jgi:hypothetical protein
MITCFLPANRYWIGSGQLYLNVPGIDPVRVPAEKALGPGGLQEYNKLDFKHNFKL